MTSVASRMAKARPIHQAKCPHRGGIFAAVWALFALVATSPSEAQPLRAELLLVGGTIVDGSGGEPFVGGVAVRDGKIVAIGDTAQVSAGRTIDCQGLVICPGFIDLHNHSDNTILGKSAAQRDVLSHARLHDTGHWQLRRGPARGWQVL